MQLVRHVFEDLLHEFSYDETFHCYHRLIRVILKVTTAQ